jgi:hypothetical protein
VGRFGPGLKTLLMPVGRISEYVVNSGRSDESEGHEHTKEGYMNFVNVAIFDTPLL